MKIVVSAFVFLVACYSSLFAQSPTNPITVLRSSRVWDGQSQAPIANGIVIIENGKIKSVGSGTAIPAGANVIDLGDVSLLPGFIDLHVHTSGEIGTNFLQTFYEGLRMNVPEQSIRASVFSRKMLDAGFTTVRNLGSNYRIDAGLRNAINKGLILGPRILAATNALGARGGHCDETGFPENTFGEESSIEDGIASGADEFRDSVRYQIKYGADVIKVCGTGGVLSIGDEVDTPQITQAEMDAIVDEAHRLRKRVAVHAHGAEGAKVAVKAGADTIEHGSFLNDEVLTMMAKQGTWLVPTLLAGEYAGKGPAAKTMPPELQKKAAEAMSKRSETFKNALKHGVKIAFGTDSGVSPHGLNAQEFALLVDHGMSPLAALRTATIDAAKAIGLEKEIGTLEPGKTADVIAMTGNPFQDIRATEKVVFVMKDGVVVKQP